MRARARAIEIEQSGLKLDLRLVEPDRAAWHLRIADMQLTTCHVLAGDAGVHELEAAVILHLARKVELARAN